MVPLWGRENENPEELVLENSKVSKLDEIQMPWAKNVLIQV